MKYKDIVSNDRRRIILELLNQEADYTANEYVIKSALAALGHKASDAAIGSEFDWLSDAGLIELKNVSEIKVAHITMRGVDVATGATIVDGVARTRPES